MSSPRPSRCSPPRPSASPACCPSGAQTFLGQLDAVIDRTADILERTAGEVEAQSRIIFSRPRGAAFEAILNRLGRAQIVNSKARDSLVSLARLLSFATLAEQFEGDKELRDHLKSLQRDVQSITDHSGYLSSNITFLLDAALGLINIEQNAIFKIFSVFSVDVPAAHPGGRHLRHELHAHARAELAARLSVRPDRHAVLAAAGPLLWSKRRGWL